MTSLLQLDTQQIDSFSLLLLLFSTGAGEKAFIETKQEIFFPTIRFVFLAPL